MHEQHGAGLMSRLGRFLRERAFYLILFLCVAVVGITAWLFSTAMERTKPQTEENLQHSVTASPTDPDALPDDAFHWLPSSIEPQTSAVDGTLEEISGGETAEPTALPEDPSQEAAAEVMATAFAWPLSGSVCAAYSVDALQYDRTMADWRTHAGMDIEGDLGAKVKAVADGTVERIYADPMYGTTLILYHGAGLRSVYSNLAAQPAVETGDSVALGQVIGAVGNTADAETGDVYHLHFAMTLDEMRVNPMDYLPSR